MAPRDRLSRAERVVVKLGTQVVTSDDGVALARVADVVEDVARLRDAGRACILVSSGAVGLGAKALARPAPRSLGMRQAFAAVGQGRLTGLYDQLFGALQVPVAQVLLSEDDLADPDRALCLRTTLLRLLELGVVPILNENDSVSVREIRSVLPRGEGRDSFGDNDGLSAHVAAAIDADLLVLLTDVNGLHTANPAEDPDAKTIATVDAVDDPLIARCSGRSTGGTGGMASKLRAARLASERGVDVVIASGMVPGTLGRLTAGGEEGTWVRTQAPASDRRRRIVLAGEAAGVFVLNDGALDALLHKKASLLPIGVTSVEGSFPKGALVELRDAHGRVRGRGLTNYDAAACERIAGHHSDDIPDLLGWRGYDALITRDNLAMGDA